MRYASGLLLFVACSGTFATPPVPRGLTFDDRVKAQEAIERVYYSHQIGATMPFEQAVTHSALEAKVRKYLEETVALQVFWKTAVTDQALQRELERMADGTRMPERLQELYAALGNDPFLVKECLARPSLVDRLTHNFHAFDPTLNAPERAQAESLRRRLATGELRASAEHPDRTVRDYIVSMDDAISSPRERPAQVRLTPEEFKTRRAELPAVAGQVSDMKETRDGFVFQVVLSETVTDLRVAAYFVPKVTWDDWWSKANGADPRDIVQAVASSDAELPMPRSGHPSGSSEPCLDDYWDSSSSDSLSLRTRHSAVWTGNLMVVWGGISEGGLAVNTGARYDPSTDSWTATTVKGAPTPRSSHSAVWTGSSMIVWGGGVDTGGRYDPSTDSWMPTSSSSAPSARSWQSAVWTGTSMVVWGGYGAAGVVNSGGRYDPTSDVWTPTSTLNAPSARNSHTAVWTGGAMVVWGGSTGGDNGAGLSTGGRYDPVSDTWSPTKTTGAPSGRYHHTAIWTGNAMVVWGGYTYDVINRFQYFDTGGRYDPVTDTWTPTSLTGAPSARYAHTGVWTGSSMVIWGGSNCCASLNTGGRYDPVKNTWSPTATTGAAAGRWEHSAVWTDSLMVVWGGNGLPADQQPAGGRYDPVTDSWTPLVGSNAPGPRIAHTAVWTGSLMVVWGGSYFGPTNTGGRYDPATDSWSPTNIAQAPDERFAHVAVWTGSRMIVWGGGNFESYWDFGGLYDPVTDHWTRMFSADPQTKIGWARAVWTGTQMLVWGGATESHAVGSVGRYDPVADRWTPMSSTGMPDPRTEHTVVWTGNRMVVWGGYSTYDGTSFFEVDTGGRYDPVSDTWRPTSTSGAPSPRIYHSAVWTGSRMVVWGGASYTGGYQLFATGGRYDPVTDTWTPTSLLNAPAGFANGSAIWTGSRALLWGGSGGGPDHSRGVGGRYDPVTDSWMPITSVNAPIARGSFTSVWTGAMMLIWGGDLLNQTGSGSGGRYLSGGSEDNDADGYTRCEGDCNDQNAMVHPGASEACNGIDDNCDGTVDNGGDALCNDNSVCTTDRCNAAAGCSFTYCNDGNPCTTDTCDAALGCIFTNNTGACNDGNACTTGDTCQGGSCLPGTGSLDCNDGNICTTDSCSPSAGCAHINNANPCDDGMACTVNDKCAGGACHGTAIVCNDNNPCTDDSCNAATGVCVFTNDDAHACSDGNLCTQTDTCQAGSCSGSNPVRCEAGCPPGFSQVGALCQRSYDIDFGLLDNQDSTCDDTGTNLYNGCNAQNYGFHWTDLGSALIAVTRVDVQLESGIYCGSTSSSVTLNGVPVGSFQPAGTCYCDSPHGPISLTSLAAGNYFKGALNAISIDPSEDCEGLSMSTSLGGNFARVTVTYAPHSIACQAGTCVPATGECNYVNRPDGATCSDDNACTTGDACGSGRCVGGPHPNCDDHSVCTLDECEPTTGCIHHPVVGGTCNDGNACTTGDTCRANGRCVGTQPRDCNDDNPCTTDSCTPRKGCIHVNNTSPCDDGNACTSDDACNGGSCRAGRALVCNDKDPCTTDTCDWRTGCVFTPDPELCSEPLRPARGTRFAPRP